MTPQAPFVVVSCWPTVDCPETVGATSASGSNRGWIVPAEYGSDVFTTGAYPAFVPVSTTEIIVPESATASVYVEPVAPGITLAFRSH